MARRAAPLSLLLLLALGAPFALPLAAAQAAEDPAEPAPYVEQENILAKGLPLPNDTLTCTPWSWAQCSQVRPGIYTVAVNAQGGGGMQAPQHYMNGIFSLDMRLPAGNTGGTIFAWYTMSTVSPSNKDPRHSEIDVEFFGNATSKEVMLALNVFANGKQNLAQYTLPFDPSAAMHTYTMVWGPEQIVWMVDGTPIRVLRRVAGQPWPTFAQKPMASVWATPWTALKADFSNGPITAVYGNYKAAGCLVAATARHGPGIQCPGPWNNPLTAAQLAAYSSFRAAHLIVEYGWDNA